MSADLGAASRSHRVVLGRTGLEVGRLGLGSSYGVPTEAVEAAFERGCNYLYWGSVRRAGFGKALRHLCKRDRDGVVFVVQSYNRVASTLGWGLRSALRRIRTGYADVLLLGWYDQLPSARLLEAALRLKEAGLVRFLALSTHNRLLAGQLMASDSAIDVVHVRYNAAHRGAEQEVFPQVPSQGGPGLVSFTATRWGTLLRPVKGMPKGLEVPSSTDCYRFVMSRPEVHVCLSGPANLEQLELGLKALEAGPLTEEELSWMRSYGELVYQSPRASLSARIFSGTEP